MRAQSEQMLNQHSTTKMLSIIKSLMCTINIELIAPSTLHYDHLQFYLMRAEWIVLRHLPLLFGK